MTALVLVLGVVLLGSSALSRQSSTSMPAASTPPWGPAGNPELNYQAIRAEYVDLSGNRDETDTTCYLVNTSASTTLFLGDFFALGPGGVNDVLVVHSALRGVKIPPLGTFELRLDSATIPGLQPKTELFHKGLELFVVSWLGPTDSLRLSAGIHLEKPGNDDNRVLTRVRGFELTR